MQLARIVFFLLLTLAGSQSRAEQITIAVASNFTMPMKKLVSVGVSEFQ